MAGSRNIALALSGRSRRLSGGRPGHTIASHRQSWGANEGATRPESDGNHGRLSLSHTRNLLKTYTSGNNGKPSLQLRTRRSGVRITPGAPFTFIGLPRFPTLLPGPTWEQMGAILRRAMIPRDFVWGTRNSPHDMSVGTSLSHGSVKSETTFGETDSARHTGGCLFFTSLDLGVFRLSLLQDRYVIIGISPQCEKVLVGLAALLWVARKRRSAR